MSQAKILNPVELRRVLDHVSTRKHSARNRCALLLTHYAGMRVGEVSSLRISDVLNDSGTIKEEIRLMPDQTKGKHARTVYINARMQKELAQYIKSLKIRDIEKPLFYTQKRDGFSANTLTQYFFFLYRRAGVDGASSHSGRRSFLTGLANKGTAIHILKSLAGHRNIATTASYLYSSPTQLKAAVELI
ncbi:site-specific integrase [Polynucleobacter sp. 86C-FISCH]|uniref:tyrosine-type recombinase/integrase n=1 Tax=Polynucleobacter sp. 86C-FISCH TaxID=2689101 RepID=UPI001C0DE6E7|nr:site-specific integrase [Polynucleobacter sp. 86C-FISCH]MBU3595647.1 site-specific integrase [Polynucleobacter sp. 86C-FISCH]